MEKYQTEFRLKVVNSFLAGDGGAKLLARRWIVPEEKIRTWVSHYRLHGIDGLRPNHKCVQRLTQKRGLRALIRAKKRSRHVPGISDVPVPSVLQRDFFAKAPNQKGATDVTEFSVHGHKLYRSSRTDLYNGEIIAHHMAKRPVFDLVPDTL